MTADKRPSRLPVSDEADRMHKRFFWGPWMFSPATVLCVVVFAGCVWVQASGLWLPRLALIYIGGIEGASLVGALMCSAISINRVSLSAPADTRPEPLEESQGLSRNPTTGDAYPMSAPEPEPEGRSSNDISPQGRVVKLDGYRRR
ncbi:hypothetical protein ACELLULO517_27430 [Acidisoma cellulosilytica]|uniref:Uncharacterized protein n=1 Tax=Acidisoma cellulosilyticum TaxID=2802395 RepID=A0A963Z8G5_9PROT|nr:hypothetical protein [Acidisoma cellulosilyticum]MCB8884000.1 hypothetical protein [Acidisoma cellulosilyticum]